MSDKNKLRIYLKCGEEIKKYLLLIEGSDGSIYLKPYCKGHLKKDIDVKLKKHTKNAINLLELEKEFQVLPTKKQIDHVSYHKDGNAHVKDTPFTCIDKGNTQVFSDFNHGKPLLICFNIPRLEKNYKRISEKDKRKSHLLVNLSELDISTVRFALFVIDKNHEGELIRPPGHHELCEIRLKKYTFLFDFYNLNAKKEKNGYFSNDVFIFPLNQSEPGFSVY